MAGSYWKITFLGMLAAVAVLVSCKPEAPRASPNQSPLFSMLATPVPIPLPVQTVRPTRVISYAILPTLDATPMPWITIIASPGRYTGGGTVVTKVVAPWTPGPSPTPLPQVQPFGMNGVLVDLRPINELIQVHIGQQFVVKASPDAQGAAYAGWDVTYDTLLLELAPRINLSKPPDTGWMWTVRNTGTTTITFKTTVPPCNTPPCPDLPSWGTTLTLQISP